MTAERLRHYAADAVQHTELMVSFFSGQQRAQLIEVMKGETGPATRLVALKNNGLDAVIADVRKQIAALIEKVEAELACDAARTQPGCSVSYRYIAQVSRNSSPEDVFVQTALAAALIRAEPRVAGLNFVGPEDYRVAREDYQAHMAMIGFLAKDVPVALHAGELWLGLVPPGDLAFHIRAAVEVAGARRIGHGVALAFERRSDELLATMRKKPVVVEINLTSNDLILNVRGKDHPLPAYRAAGVPLVLSTDDAGVSRIDLTNEYFRAARDYRLGYRALKEIARNSLTYSFLGDADKQAELKRFDQSTAEFERAVAAERSVFGNMGTLIGSLFAP
jgi:adenosine deaminase